MWREGPGLEQWDKLYKSSVLFRDSECWEWMSDEEIFGVQNPYTGEIGYCCIMGSGGDLFGLAVYLGEEGLKIYYDILDRKFRQDEALYIQNSLLASFEDRSSIDNKDYKVIKELGLKFRGKKKWPSFRSFKPGYYPWYLEEDEVVFLDISLRQALNVAQKYRIDKNVLKSKEEGEILVRVPRKEGSEIIWTDTFRKIYFKEEDLSKYYMFDELKAKRLQSRKITRGTVWEVDFFHSPAPVKGDHRPYFPIIYMIADSNSGMVIDIEMTEELNDYITIFQEKFMRDIEKAGIIPQVVCIQRESVYKALDPIAKRLGISLRPVEELNVIEDYKYELDSLITE